MNGLYSVTQIRQIEQAALTKLAPGTLMNRAAEAASNAALEILSARRSDARVLVLAGPGNNGGDALLTATHLAQIGVDVTILLFADERKLPADAQNALAIAR